MKMKRMFGAVFAAILMLGVGTAFAFEAGAGAMLKVDNVKERPGPTVGPTMLAMNPVGAITVVDTKLNLPPIMTAGIAANLKAKIDLGARDLPNGDGITSGGAESSTAAIEPVKPDFTDSFGRLGK